MGTEVRLTDTQLETKVSDLRLLAHNIVDLTQRSHAPTAIKARLTKSADRIFEACNDWERYARRPEAPPEAPHPTPGCFKHSEAVLLDDQGNCPVCDEVKK